MNLVTDPELLKELESGYRASSGAPSVSPRGETTPDEQTQSAPQEGRNWGLYNQEDGSIMDSIGSGMSRLGRATAAAFVPVGDDDMSDYAISRARIASAENKADMEKLGYAGQIAAGAATYAPVIAAGLANPVAGAALMGGATTADSLASQLDNNQDLDLDSALGAGITSAGVDLATMGMASKGMDIAKTLTSPLRRGAAGTAVQAAQGATSNAAAQASINLASGRPWNENLGEAATIGAVAGGGLHATLSGLNRTTGSPENPGGKKSIDDQVKFETKSGITPSNDYRNQVYEYDNKRYQYDNDIDNIDIDNIADLDSAVKAKVGLAMENSTASAVKDAAKIYEKYNFPNTINIWDVEAGHGIASPETGNIARDWFQFSPQQLSDAGESITRARQTITGRAKAREAGEFDTAFSEKLKESYDKAQTEFESRASANHRLIETIRANSRDAERGVKDNLTDLSRNLDSYQKMIRDANNGKAPDMDTLRRTVEDIERLSKLTGTRDRLKSLVDDGDRFDGVSNLQTALLVSRGTKKLDTSIKNANPNSMKVNAQAGNMIDAASVATGHLWVPLLRRTGVEIGGKLSQRRLRKAKEEGSAVTRSLAQEPASFRNRAAEAGDFKGGAAEAAADLESMGINTGGARQQVENDVWGREVEPVARPEDTPPVQESAPVQEPELDVWGRPREFTDLTGRSVRDAEAEAIARRQAEEAAANEPTPVDPEVEAAARAQRAAALSQDARVQSKRTAPKEEPAKAEDFNPDNQARIVLDDGTMVVMRPDGSRQVVRGPLGEDIAVTQARVDAEDAANIRAQEEAAFAAREQEIASRNADNAANARVESQRRSPAAPKDDAEAVAQAIVESNRRRTDEARIANERHLESVEGGKSETIGDEGLTIVHGSGKGDMTLDDIQIVRDGQKQGKKGRKYGGFYGAREADVAHAEGYAGMSGSDTPTVYDVKVKPGTKVFHKEGDITRLSENYINDLKSKGYGVVAGTDPRGRVEYAVIDKDAVQSMNPRKKTQEAPRATEEPKTSEAKGEQEKSVEPELESEKQGVKSSDLVRRPISDRLDEIKNLPTKEKNTMPIINEQQRLRRQLKEVNKAVSDKATQLSVPEEQIWRILERQGGVERVFAEDNSASRGLNLLMSKDKIEVSRRAEAEAAAAEKAVDNVVAPKGDGTVVDPEVTIANMKKDFMSKGVSEETFNEARVKAAKDLGDDYTPTQLANVVKVLAKEKAAKAREEAKANKPKGDKVVRPAKPEKGPERTMEDSWRDINGYAKASGVDADPEVQKAIREAMNAGNRMRSQFAPLSDAAERKLYNIIDRAADNANRVPEQARTMQDSWDEINGYAQALGVEGEPEIRKALKKAMNPGNKKRNAFGPLSQTKEREMYNVIDDFIKGQEEAYEAALARPKTEQPAELGEWRKRVADLKKRRARVSNFNEWQNQKANARKKAAEEKIRQEDVRKERLEAEAKKAEEEAKKAYEVVEALNEAKAKQVEDAKEAVREEFAEKQMDNDVITEAGTNLFEKLADRVHNTDSPDYVKLKAVMDVISENLTTGPFRKGERDPQRALLNAQKALFDGLQRKAEFPNNPELWLSTTERNAIGEAYTGKVGTKEYGSMYQKLRAGLFEDEQTREFVKFPIEAINKKIKHLRKRQEGVRDLSEGAINVQDIK